MESYSIYIYIYTFIYFSLTQELSMLKPTLATPRLTTIDNAEEAVDGKVAAALFVSYAVAVSDLAFTIGI